MMFDDTTTPRARHWAGPALAGAILWTVARVSLTPVSTLQWVLYACTIVFWFWAAINFMHHFAHAIAGMIDEYREMSFRMSENFFAEQVAHMNEAQLRAIRTGRHVIEVIPGEKGPIEKLWGSEVFLFTAWYILTMSSKENVHPINRFQSGTYHFDMLGDHAVDDYTQAREFTAYLCRYGWAKWGLGVPLVVLTSPYRSILRPLLEYLDQIQSRGDDQMVTIVLPEFLPRRWWQHALHNQTALLVKGALLFRRNTVVADVPYLLKR